MSEREPYLIKSSIMDLILHDIVSSRGTVDRIPVFCLVPVQCRSNALRRDWMLVTFHCMHSVKIQHHLLAENALHFHCQLVYHQCQFAMLTLRHWFLYALYTANFQCHHMPLLHNAALECCNCIPMQVFTDANTRGHELAYTSIVHISATALLSNSHGTRGKLPKRQSRAGPRNPPATALTAPLWVSPEGPSPYWVKGEQKCIWNLTYFLFFSLVSNAFLFLCSSIHCSVSFIHFLLAHSVTMCYFFFSCS